MSTWSDRVRHVDPALLVFAAAIVGQTAIVCYLWNSNRITEVRLVEAEEALDKQIKLRAVERAGRISVQQAKRQTTSKLNESNGYNYHPIGTVESPFPDRRGTPRQPSLVPAARGKIRFNKKLIQHDHFKELSQFSHVWVLFVFHNNTNTEKETLAARIKPPRLHGTKVGCLSTRSPHRPNNIGLSVCEVIGVGQDYLEIRCVDMVDGTPVIDVKPYIPYDVVPSPYTLPMAIAADGTPLNTRQLSVPEWVVEADIPMLPVLIPDTVRQSIERGVDRTGRKRPWCCSTAQEAVELITQVLRQDIRGVHQGRGTTAITTTGTPNRALLSEKKATNSTGTEVTVGYKCTLDGMQISFTTTETGITVQSVTFVSSKADTEESS